MGSQINKTLQVEKKIFKKSEVEKFFKEKTLKYSYSSLGDMSFASVFHRGFGWITSDIIKDDPLFNGQEVSIRKTNILKDFPDMCYDSPKEFEYNHVLFKKIYENLSSKMENSNLNQFDDIRWCIPGTFQTGIMVMMNVRSFSRHLDKMRNISFCKKTFKK